MGQPSLAYAAFDSALQLAKEGQYLWSEALAVRARTVAGKRAGGAGPHDWGKYAGLERLSEVQGRMAVGAWQWTLVQGRMAVGKAS